MPSVIPDRIDPVVAYRCWNISYLELVPIGYLYSSGWTILKWEPMIPISAKHFALAPVYTPIKEDRIHNFSECSALYKCGIYGEKSLNNTSSLDEIVLGQVYLWGLIVEHELGYRAQYAYPKCLYYDGVKDKEIDMIANNYKIPAIEPPVVKEPEIDIEKILAFGPMYIAVGDTGDLNATTRDTGV